MVDPVPDAIAVRRDGLGRHVLGRLAGTRHPAVATLGVMSRVTAAVFVGGGLLAFTESLGGLDSGTSGLGHTADIRVAGLAAVLSGLLILAAGPRLRRRDYHLALGWGTVLITAAVWFAADTPSAAVLAALYSAVAIGASFFFTWPAALGHLVAVVGAGLLAFAGTTLPVIDRLVVLGTVAMVAVAAGWLMRMADGAEADGLTGLPNRRGFDRAVQEAVSAAARDHRPLAVALLDFDHFKQINDRAGPVGGDRLLQVTSAAWQCELSPDQLLARYSGDRFALLLPGCTVEQARALVEGLRERLTAGTCSAGIAAVEAGDSGSLVTGRAGAALYEAKRTGRNRVVLAGVVESAPLLHELRSALARDELFLVYQPVVALESAEIVGVEALVRWRHPTRGVLGPDAFIPAAEADELIHDLGRWVTTHAVAQGVRWRERHGFTPNIAVNVAGPELGSPGYADRLLALLADAGLPPDRFVLEVTETTLDADSCAVTTALAELRARGMKVAIDDFGTGWSSLSRLDRLPLDILKIDRSFIEPLDQPDARTTLLGAVVALGRALGFDIVAEGVETPRQAGIVRRLGCGFVQGYFYARPAEIVDDALPTLGAGTTTTNPPSAAPATVATANRTAQLVTTPP
jgi:diguanylate cyclase (GGDEF)-like protein